MNRKILTLILAVALIASFFLPLSSGSTAYSAFDIVKASSPGGGGIEIMLMKYIWIIFPLSGLMLLVGAVNNENYFLGRGVWAWLPLLAVIYIIVRPVTNGVNIMDMVKGFGVGMWVAVAASIAAAFIWPKK
jgi:hypothetical protein